MYHMSFVQSRRTRSQKATQHGHGRFLNVRHGFSLVDRCFGSQDSQLCLARGASAVKVSENKAVGGVPFSHTFLASKGTISSQQSGTRELMSTKQAAAQAVHRQ